MSRVGRSPVYFEKEVQVTLNKNIVLIKGAKFTESVELKPVIQATVNDGQVVLTRTNEEPQSRAFHGLYRALIQNAVTGVTKGWSKTLILKGVGYRASVAGKKLDLILGYSHPISLEIPEGVTASVVKNTTLTLTGPSREVIGQLAAKIRGFRPPEPYLGKGIRYSDEVIRRKAGKSAGK